MGKHQQNIVWLNCSFPNFSELKVVKDLSYFDKGQIVMARWNGKVCGMFLVSRHKNLPTVIQGATKPNLATGCWAAKATMGMWASEGHLGDGEEGRLIF